MVGAECIKIFLVIKKGNKSMGNPFSDNDMINLEFALVNTIEIMDKDPYSKEKDHRGTSRFERMEELLEKVRKMGYEDTKLGNCLRDVPLVYFQEDKDKP